MSSQAIGVTGVAGRYATALFELAESQGKLDDVASDLKDLGQLIEESEDLNRVVRSPVMSRDEQAKAMQAVLAAGKASELTQRFIGVVCQNRRLFTLSLMIKGFQALLAAHRGEATAEVVSAKELSDQQLSSLRDELKKAIGTDVSVDTRVDASLLGGLIVKVGSRMIDSSLKTKLQQLRLAMKGVA